MQPLPPAEALEPELPWVPLLFGPWQVISRMRLWKPQMTGILGCCCCCVCCCDYYWEVVADVPEDDGCCVVVLFDWLAVVGC